MDLKKRIKQSIKKEGLTYEKLDDLFQLVRETREREWIQYIRSQAMKIPTPEAYSLIYKTYLLGAQDSFDDYMSACEFYREPAARFWWPRRKVLEGQHKIATQIQEFLDDPEALYLGFSMPPGTGKSTLIKFLLAYIAGRYPQSANMYVSYSDGMVKMIEDSVRSILTDVGEYRHNDIFPDNPSPDMSAEFHTISYRKKGDFPTIGLVSLGGSVTGRTRANKFLITDDLVKNAEVARSPERLEKLYADYKSTLTTRMIGDNVKQIQLGTIWSVYDPISRMKSEHDGDPRYRFIAIPVWDDDEVSNFEYEHPDRYTTERIREIKGNLDPVDFSCLFMQRGIEREGLAFPYDALNYYNGVLPGDEPDNILFFCDVAFGGGDSLSMPICYVYGESGYIVDVLFDKRDKEVTEPRVVGKILHHGCKMGRFEANNGGDFFAEDVSRMLKEKGYRCNIGTKRAPTTMSKISRVEQYAPDIRKLYFLTESERSEEYTRFMTELTGFSFTGKNAHDDAPDSLAGLCAYLFEKSKTVSVAKRPF